MKYQAVRTEYKGVVYRSKSEAMFARYLELDIENDAVFNAETGFGGGFIYETEGLFEDRTVDFLRWEVRPCFSAPPDFYLEVIEYKPSRPTRTYCDVFAESITKMVNTRESHGLNDMTFAKYNVYYGNHWTQDRGIVSIAGSLNAGWSVDDWYDQCDWLRPFEDRVIATRFDLQESTL